MSNSELSIYIKDRVIGLASASGLPSSQVADDQDLFMSGVLDSLSFLTLVSEVVERFGASPDLSAYEPQEYSSISGLVRVLSPSCA